MTRAINRPFWLLLFLFAAQAYAQQVVAPTFPNPGKTSMSKNEQHALGMKVAAEVYKQMPVLSDESPEAQYVRRLGAKLVATIPPEVSWPFEFHVVPQKEINAFALPGGQMFINVGTITAAKNEGELAGVMGHEMAHVYMQHSAKQASKAQTTSLLAGIAAAVVGATGVGEKAGGLVGQLATMGIEVGAQGLMMKYSRKDEAQADAVGAVILHQAGYEPKAMADFFQTMGEQGGKTPPVFFSSHPAAANRQQAIQKQIANWPQKSYVAESPDFDKVRKSAGQLKVYTAEEIAKGAKTGQWAALNQRNGASLASTGESTFPTRGEVEAMASPNAVLVEKVLPSGRMKQVSLGPIRIDHPENWQVILPERQGQFVTIAAEPAITKNGVGYGVLLNGAPASGKRANIDEMTTDLIQRIQDNNELEQLGKPEPITVGGVEARSTHLQSPSPFPDASGQPQKERDWLITVPRNDGSMVFMIFVAPQSDFDRFRPTYEAMLKSVKFK